MKYAVPPARRKDKTAALSDEMAAFFWNQLEACWESPPKRPKIQVVVRNLETLAVAPTPVGVEFLPPYVEKKPKLKDHASVNLPLGSIPRQEVRADVCVGPEMVAGGRSASYFPPPASRREGPLGHNSMAPNTLSTSDSFYPPGLPPKLGQGPRPVTANNAPPSKNGSDDPTRPFTVNNPDREPFKPPQEPPAPDNKPPVTPSSGRHKPASITPEVEDEGCWSSFMSAICCRSR